MSKSDIHQFNLSIPFPTFGAVPFELVDQELDNAGIDYIYAAHLYIKLFGVLDWKKTIRIGVHDFMSGHTGYLSDKAIMKLLRCNSNNTARKAMKMLLDAGLITRHKNLGDRCYFYKICLFDPVVEFLKANPPETVKVEYLKKDDAFDKEFKHTNKGNKTMPEPASEDASDDDKDASHAHNQESFKNLSPGPHPPSNIITRDADKKRGGEGRLNQSEDRGQPSTPSRPSETQKSISETKNRVLPDADLDQIVDSWLGDSLEFTPDTFRQELAFEFNDAIHEFILPLARRHAPDCPETACRDVILNWVAAVKDRHKPARYVSYIRTGPGKQALVDALRSELGSIAAAQAMELDPTIAAMWEERYGANWKEKRREMTGYA